MTDERRALHAAMHAYHVAKLAYELDPTSANAEVLDKADESFEAAVSRDNTKKAA
jgi:hypothetical protein